METVFLPTSIMTVQRRFQVRVYVIVLLLTLGVPLAGLMMAFAQDGGDQAQKNPSSVFDLPHWAESQSARAPFESESELVQTKGPGLPPSPEVPIWGLGWLLLTGAGYGIWRLWGAEGTTPADP